MKYCGSFFFLSVLFLTLGCSKSRPDGAAAEGDAVPAEGASAEGGQQAATGDGTAATSEGGIALTPENTTITFVGSHKREDPEPRTGHFQQFAGTAAVGDSGLEAVEVEIETASLTTEIDGLTGHLKQPDFFDVREHPTATFRSTSVEAGEDGMVTITGDLTLLDQTNSISFPATVSTDGGLNLQADFEIDRTTFGMDYGPERVEEQVQLKIEVSE